MKDVYNKEAFRVIRLPIVLGCPALVGYIQGWELVPIIMALMALITIVINSLRLYAVRLFGAKDVIRQTAFIAFVGVAFILIIVLFNSSFYLLYH